MPTISHAGLTLTGGQPGNCAISDRQGERMDADQNDSRVVVHE